MCDLPSVTVLSPWVPLWGPWKIFLQGALSPLSRADPDCVLNVVDKDLSIPVISRIDLLYHPLYDLLSYLLAHHCLHLHLRQQIDRVLGSPVHLLIPFLIPIAHNVADHNAVGFAVLQNSL